MGLRERLGLDDIIKGMLSSDDDGVVGNWGGLSSMAERLMRERERDLFYVYVARARERERERFLG